MQGKFKKIVAALLVVCFAVSCAIYLPTLVEATEQVYSNESNSGERGEVCTSLSGTGALDYYTGNYAYDILSTKSANAIETSLRALMTNTHTKISSYDDCHNKANQTDCENNDGKVSLIYTSYSATMDQWNGWNREHVWPQSLGGGNTTGGGADLHHIRPSDAGVNSSRGNKKYGEADSGASEKYGTDPANGVLGGTYNNTYFEPLDHVKGDVARICLYVYVRWNSDWGASDITDVFQSVDVLLDWCELDPVDTWEMGRNEVVENIQGNRNVFIDYPEYAWLIFGEEIPENMTTPSGNAKSETEGTTTEKPTEPPTEPPEEPTPDTPSDVTEEPLLNNIFYGDTLQFMFASQSKPTVTYTDDNGQAVNIDVKPFIDKGEQVYVNGYPAWIATKGMAPQSIDKKIQVTVGARTETYSVLEYLYTRLYVSENTSANERHFCTTLIDYAKKADVALNHVAESNIGSEYLVRITNGTIDGKTASDLFAAGDAPLKNLTADITASEGKIIAYEVSVTVDGATEKKVYSKEEIKSLTVTGHTVITAIEVEQIIPKDPKWVLVTDISQLSAGKKIIIVAGDYDFAISTTQNGNNRGQTAIKKSADVIESPSSSVQVITLAAGTKSGTFAFNTGSAGYLYAASSSSNYLRTKTELDDNGSWKITINSNGIATIQSQGSYTRNTIMYNKSSSLFACYGSSSTQQTVSIYVYTE